MKTTHITLGCLLALSPLGTLRAASCMAVPSDLDFGEYSVFSTMPLDGAGRVGISCNSGMGGSETVGYSISISGSNRTVGGNMAPRMLTGPGEPLQYNLYIDANRSMVLGDGSSGTAQFSGSIAVPAMGSNSAMHTVFGRIPAQQPRIAPGRYSDALVITVAY